MPEKESQPCRDERLKDVRYHAVMPDTEGEMWNVHTHGLETVGHKELQILAPGFCRPTVVQLLALMAERIIIAGERLKPGERISVEGSTCRCDEVPGDFAGEPTRLRIVEVPDPSMCTACGGSQATQGEDGFRAQDLT